MSLRDLLEEKSIRRALIVDDVCDAVPTVNDIDPGNEAWPTFNDDLREEHQKKIGDAYPLAFDRRFDELIADDGYIAAVWNLRDELGAICEPVFATYIDDQESDQRHIDLAVNRLEALGLNCETSGREFIDAAQSVDLILIDLFFSKTQDDNALKESKTKLRQALEARRINPPLVILMSRSHRLEAKRDEFRDDVGLLDSAFRIVRKADLEDTDRLERQLERLAENATDSRRLANFFCTVEKGMQKATESTLELLRKLRLSDVGQIQQLLLTVEGEPTGSYLVDVFDRVLQHEIERDTGIIDAAIELNQFSTTSHPPPYVAGSPELQELVERLLTQNPERLRLPGALEASVAFGDILKVSENAKIDRLKSVLLVDLSTDKVLLVLTPACDLQRSGVPRILLLVGTAKPLNALDWSYGDDAHTPAIRIGEELRWIKWDLKHIDTVSRDQLDQVLGSNDLFIAARLREAHVLELQQRVLSGLGRVGVIATLPATFPVDVEAYYANLKGEPERLDVPALAEGAVCFVGRDNESAPVLRLIMTDHCCDSVIDSYVALDKAHIAEGARIAFTHVRASDDLRQMLTTGINLKGAKDSGWSHIPSLTGRDANIPKMGLLAWNYQNSTDVLSNKDLSKAGVIILVKDQAQAKTPGFETAIRSGLIQPEPDDPNSE
ncbi:MAG: hypothetical protein GY820_07495 [Gammaproteobacteria bacterium]|nr:hypothetical protein [Gammaproteobacteria bacterium]